MNKDPTRPVEAIAVIPTLSPYSDDRSRSWQRRFLAEVATLLELKLSEWKNLTAFLRTEYVFVSARGVLARVHAWLTWPSASVVTFTGVHAGSQSSQEH